MTADIIIASDQVTQIASQGEGIQGHACYGQQEQLWGVRRLLGDHDDQDDQISGFWTAGISPLTLRVSALFGIRRQMIKTADSHLSRFRLSANDDTSYQVEYWGVQDVIMGGVQPY